MKNPFFFIIAKNDVMMIHKRIIKKQNKGVIKSLSKYICTKNIVFNKIDKYYKLNIK